MERGTLDTKSTEPAIAPYVCYRTDVRGLQTEQWHLIHSHLKASSMLYTIAVILIILWLLGVVTSFTMGGFIHILLIIAIISVLLRVIG